MDDQRSATPNVDRWLSKNVLEGQPVEERLAAAERRIDQLEAEFAAARQLLLALFDEAPSRSKLFERFCQLCDQARSSSGGGDRVIDKALRDLEQTIATR